ncbi:MAG: hypothetical protein GTO45_12325 [Candidatus Aminicenantes bacterium]|nr:hypothetical protein [Candidatus Aminicenantes bacterium]NIM79589.1 hypothetical protein [Candidatus Aminicenantes bacterium]NIN18898.1 hypothetical protein [Candidatus Aminicenantes bacterium]NIN42808.1 hypothetical protein [Candidatus Aminicenantes bacterium]NIN85535.1 hypothetical protein [Candidatus Aminicenantes bacterium]
MTRVKKLTIFMSLVFFVFATAIPLLSTPQKQEDPLRIIMKRGTAGMKLQGGKSIVVKNNKLYVKSGKILRSIFPDKPRLMVKSNTSGINSKDIQSLAMSAVKSKLGGLYNRSYKIHTHCQLKSKRGKEKTVVCHLVFEHKNIWYAEKRVLELDISANNTLKQSRVVGKPLMLKTSPLKLKKKSVKGKPVRGKSKMVVAPSAVKKKQIKLDTAKITTFTSKYQSFKSVPLTELYRGIDLSRLVLVPRAKALANTAYPEVVTAEEATHQVHAIMQCSLGSASKLIGPTQSSSNAVLNYLRSDSNLVAWNNIGHGDSATLYQNGTQINSTDFTTGVDFRGLSGCVCLINSCQTFHDPLKANILSHSPRVYIAGVLNLPMVTSEGSNPNFWFKTLFQHKPMTVAYSETNTESGLTGYWGYWGDTGTF